MNKVQFNLDYKLSPIYSQTIKHMAADSKASFQNFQTPGWTSIMHTEASAEPYFTKSDLNHNKILDKLNKMENIDLSESNYSKIRVPQNTKGNNLIFFDQQRHNTMVEDSRKRSQKQNGQRMSEQYEFKSHHLQSNKTQSRVSCNSLKDSNISQRQNRSGVIIKNKPQLQKSINSQTSKRFKQITVHEHLYLDGKRLQTKKIMEQILDQQYKKQNILSFKPKINQKSQQLAEIKFSRLKERSEIDQELSEELKRSSICPSRKQQSLGEQQRQLRQHNKCKTINNLFYYLSRGRDTINRQSIKQIIEQLPLACIKTLEKVIEQIYLGKVLTWLQFLSLTNDKKTVSNKQALVNVFQKWQTRKNKGKEPLIESIAH